MRDLKAWLKFADDHMLKDTVKFCNGFPKSWLEPPKNQKHMDCAEETSLCQEANKFSWTSQFCQEEWLKKSTRGLSKLKMKKGTFKPNIRITVCIFLSRQSFSHFQKTYNKFIIESNLKGFCDKVVCVPLIPSQKK